MSTRKTTGEGAKNISTASKADSLNEFKKSSLEFRSRVKPLQNNIASLEAKLSEAMAERKALIQLTHQQLFNPLNKPALC